MVPRYAGTHPEPIAHGWILAQYRYLSSRSHSLVTCTCTRTCTYCSCPGPCELDRALLLPLAGGPNLETIPLHSPLSVPSLPRHHPQPIPVPITHPHTRTRTHTHSLTQYLHLPDLPTHHHHHLVLAPSPPPAHIVHSPLASASHLNLVFPFCQRWLAVVGLVPVPVSALLCVVVVVLRHARLCWASPLGGGGFCMTEATRPVSVSMSIHPCA